MSSTDYVKKIFEQCKRGIAKAQAVIKRNQDMVDKYNKEIQIWQKKKNADPNFSMPEPTPPKQNEAALDVACCSNVSNIVGSQLTDSDINQLNICLQNETKKATKNLRDLEKNKINQQKVDEDSRIAEQEASRERKKAEDAINIANQKSAIAELAEKNAKEKRERAEALANALEERIAAAKMRADAVQGGTNKQTTVISVVIVIFIILISLSVLSGLGGIVLLNQ